MLEKLGKHDEHINIQNKLKYPLNDKGMINSLFFFFSFFNKCFIKRKLFYAILWTKSYLILPRVVQKIEP